jgi:hypothetical protein
MSRVQLPKRSVSELVALYNLEKSLRDLYVEGPQDRVLARAGLKQLGAGAIQVYPIEVVNVPDPLVHSRNLEVGSKGRLVCLAKELEEKGPPDISGLVACLADTDLDLVLQRATPGMVLVYTSSSTLDAGVMSTSVLDRFLDQVMLIDDHDPAILHNDVVDIAKKRFLHRCALSSLGIPEPGYETSRHASLVGRRIEFDEGTFVTRMLHIANASARRNEFDAAIARLDPIRAAACSHFFHLDDCGDLLHYWCKSQKAKLTPARDEIVGVLRFFLDFRALAALPEIQQVRLRLA